MRFIIKEISYQQAVEKFFSTFLCKDGGELWGNVYFYGLLINNKVCMMRFLGNMDAKLDAKGRVFVPASFRKLLQDNGNDKLVLRKDVHQRCLVLYPEAEWFCTLNQLRRNLNPWNARHQMIFRQFVSDAEVLTIDGNGRILIPKRYQQLAGLEGEVRFIGMDAVIEVWAKELADRPFLAAEEFSKAMESVLGQGEGMYCGEGCGDGWGETIREMMEEKQ